VNFQFSTAANILFGSGRINDVSFILEQTGTHPFFVTGKNMQRAEPVLEKLRKQDRKLTVFSVEAEPTIEKIVEGAGIAVENHCDVVVGMGGGSVIDGAKAIAALIKNQDDIMTYLEVIGLGKTLRNEPAPWIAIPTTAGTGAEVTKNAVLTSREHGVKVSLRHPGMLPRFAVIDPDLTLSMPPHLTAATGLDAFTQVLEPYVSIHANPLTDALCCEALGRAAASLPKAYRDGGDRGAREDLCAVSLFGGLALANAKLGAVHGFAAAIGGMFDIPHGMVCARLLPIVTAANINALQHIHDVEFLNRYRTVARLLTGDFQADAIDGVQWIQDLCQTFQIPKLSRYGITEKHFTEVITRTEKTSSIKGNPVQLKREELFGILEKAVLA